MLQQCDDDSNFFDDDNNWDDPDKPVMEGSDDEFSDFEVNESDDIARSPHFTTNQSKCSIIKWLYRHVSYHLCKLLLLHQVRASELPRPPRLFISSVPNCRQLFSSKGRLWLVFHTRPEIVKETNIYARKMMGAEK